MHSRREDAFKEGHFSKKRTDRQTYYVLYNIDLDQIICQLTSLVQLFKIMTRDSKQVGSIYRS